MSESKAHRLIQCSKCGLNKITSCTCVSSTPVARFCKRCGSKMTSRKVSVTENDFHPLTGVKNKRVEVIYTCPSYSWFSLHDKYITDESGYFIQFAIN